MSYVDTSYSSSSAAPGPLKNPGALKVGRAAARFGALRSAREPFLIRARRIARLTLPLIFREYGENSTTSETLPWQTGGGHCVNVLAAKLILALYPPGIPFIELTPEQHVLDALDTGGPGMGHNGGPSLSGQDDADFKAKLKDAIDKGLSKVELEFINMVEEDGDRAVLFDAIRHLIIGGNHCIKIDPHDGCLHSIPLERYVVQRDGGGRLLEFVIAVSMAWESLPSDIRSMCLAQGYQENADAVVQQPVTVYTHGCRCGPADDTAQFDLYQECWGMEVPGSRTVLNDDALPYLFLRMIALEAESYGRSYCEDYEADLQTLDGYMQILTEGAATAAQAKWLVKPGGVTNKEMFMRLANGGVMTGDPEDVSMVRSEKEADFNVAMQIMDKVEKRLQTAFLVNSAIQRSGERVTATEIQWMAKELETTLGGVYSNQVVTFQAPYAKKKLAVGQRLGRVTKLPKGTTKITILTGDAALGRLQKAQSLEEYLTAATEVLGATPSIISPYINISTFLTRAGANRQIDTDGLIKSEDEVQQAAQAEKADALTAQVAPEAVKQAGQMQQNVQTGQGAPLGAAPPGPPAEAPAPPPAQ